MTELYIVSKFAAEATRCGASIHQVHAEPTCQRFTPPLEGLGKTRRYGKYHLLALMIHTRLTGLGMSIPAAGRIVGRMMEEIAFNRNAGAIVIECHENGANVFYAVDRDDLTFERSDASRAAGQSYVRLTIDLVACRALVDAAFALYGRPVDADDVE